MNKLEFNTLTIIEQINYVNERVKLSTTAQVCRDIGIPRNTFRDRVKRVEYVFNEDVKQFEPLNKEVIQLHQNNVKVQREVHGEDINPIASKNTNVILKYENDLLDLIENKTDLLEMLKNYKNNIDIIEVPQLDINSLPEELQKDIINKSIKLYQPVQKLYDKVCNKYPGFKKQDLISLALYEFCLKYKK